MAKLYVLMGKSASGKDTVYQRLLNDALNLKPVVLYTTRPRRLGEEDGKDYYFVDEGRMGELEDAGKIIEHRVYQTVHGAWHYFTADDGQIDLVGAQNYLMIDTLEGYLKLRNYFGGGNVVPLYIEVEDGLRLSRALERERGQKNPRYKEMCRRYLADTEDFSEENLCAAGILRKFVNEKLDECIRELGHTIRGEDIDIYT
jgi:guanylate kinase